MRHPIVWHRQKDSNLRLSVLETDALPTEPYRRIEVDTCGLEPHSQDFQSCAYTMSAKCPLAEAERFELSEPLARLGPLAEGWFRPLTHASFVLTLQSYHPAPHPICVPQKFLQKIPTFPLFHHLHHTTNDRSHSGNGRLIYRLFYL